MKRMRAPARAQLRDIGPAYSGRGGTVCGGLWQGVASRWPLATAPLVVTQLPGLFTAWHANPAAPGIRPKACPMLPSPTLAPCGPRTLCRCHSTYLAVRKKRVCTLYARIRASRRAVVELFYLPASVVQHWAQSR